MAGDIALGLGAGLNYKLPQNIGYDPMLEKQKERDYRTAENLKKLAAEQEAKADKGYQEVLKSITVIDPKMRPYFKEKYREKAAEVINYLHKNHSKEGFRYNPYNDPEFTNKLMPQLFDMKSAAQLASDQANAADTFILNSKPDEIEHKEISVAGNVMPMYKVQQMADRGDKAAIAALDAVGMYRAADEYAVKKEKPMDFVKYVREYANPLQPTTKTGESGNQEIFELTPKEIEGHLQTLANSNPALGEWINQNPDEAARIISDNARKTSAKYHAPQGGATFNFGGEINTNPNIGDTDKIDDFTVRRIDKTGKQLNEVHQFNNYAVTSLSGNPTVDVPRGQAVRIDGGKDESSNKSSNIDGKMTRIYAAPIYNKGVKSKDGKDLSGKPVRKNEEADPNQAKNFSYQPMVRIVEDAKDSKGRKTGAENVYLVPLSGAEYALFASQKQGLVKGVDKIISNTYETAKNLNGKKGENTSAKPTPTSSYVTADGKSRVNVTGYSQAQIDKAIKDGIIKLSK